MNKKQKAYKKGLWAETLAAWVLRVKGYRILEMRYKTPVGEIDLIAQRGRTIAFIEVKARSTNTAAAEAITPKNQSRVARAAQYYTSHNPHLSDFTLRFDAILVGNGQFPRHIKDAWQLPPQFGIV